MLLAGPHVVTAGNGRGMELDTHSTRTESSGERSEVPKPLTSDARNPSPALGRSLKQRTPASQPEVTGRYAIAHGRPGPLRRRATW